MHPNIAGFSSGVKSASAQIKDTPGQVHSVTIIWGDTAQNDFQLRDGGAGGSVRWRATRIAMAADGDETQHFEFPAGAHFATDIYAEIVAGTGLQYVVIYK